MKLKSLLITILAIFTISISSAQLKNTSQEIATKIKSRKLLVLLEEETYSEIKQMNENFQRAVKKYWNFSDDYIFVKENQLDQYNKSDYAILAFEKFLVKELTLLGGRPTNTEIHLNAGLLDNYKPKHASCSINLIHEYVSNNDGADYDLYVANKDIIFGVQRINKMLWNAFEGNDSFFYNEIKDRDSSLKEETLLIDREYLSEKLDKNSITEIYPYKFEILNSEVIAEKINSNKESYAYLGYIRSILGSAGTSHSFFVYVINAESGTMISSAGQPIKFQLVIKKKHLKKILKKDK
jgi:hypothetical protein